MARLLFFHGKFQINLIFSASRLFFFQHKFVIFGSIFIGAVLSFRFVNIYLMNNLFQESYFFEV